MKKFALPIALIFFASPLLAESITVYVNSTAYTIIEVEDTIKKFVISNQHYTAKKKENNKIQIKALSKDADPATLKIVGKNGTLQLKLVCDAEQASFYYDLTPNAHNSDKGYLSVLVKNENVEIHAQEGKKNARIVTIARYKGDIYLKVKIKSPKLVNELSNVKVSTSGKYSDSIEAQYKLLEKHQMLLIKLTPKKLKDPLYLWLVDLEEKKRIMFSFTPESYV